MGGRAAGRDIGAGFGLVGQSHLDPKRCLLRTRRSPPTDVESLWVMRRVSAQESGNEAEEMARVLLIVETVQCEDRDSWWLFLASLELS